RPPLFCPLSPEAYLLTGTFFIYHVMGRREGPSSMSIAAVQGEEDASCLSMTEGQSHFSPSKSLDFTYSA
ncbi:hypothetical protein, partial [Mucilaginibacter sp.]|uniref:hypothetical protein n=1 Tax=Mucilaginibacter sp. TaxID=1882438 RepID=UPI002ED200B1